MNRIILSGNLTKDPELKQTNNGTTICAFTVACNRKFKDANGNRVTDFLNCVAWRQTAEFVAKHFSKGKAILVEGTLQTRSYDAQDGSKRYATEVICDNVEFCGHKTEGRSAEPQNDGFTPVDDEDLPF